MRFHRLTGCLYFIVAAVVECPTVYAQDFDKVQISSEQVSEHIYMLQGRGGNIGVSVGEDGVFLIDDQFAPLTEKIRASISKISDKTIRFVINTHWHFDHVGGNEHMGEAGTVIVAHENVRRRMSTDQTIAFFKKIVPAAAKVALPVITFTQDINLHLNGDEAHIFHVQNAHTDGDAVVFFKKENVIHAGDIYFAGFYPFIDVSSDGSVEGVIKAAKHILSMINDDTKVIPGHGPLSNKAELTVYVEMLEAMRDRVRNYISEGKTLTEIQALAPSKDFDAEWADGFLTANQFVQILYEDLSRKK